MTAIFPNQTSCLRRVVVSEQWQLKAGGLLIQVVSNTGLTVLFSFDVFCTNTEI